MADILDMVRWKLLILFFLSLFLVRCGYLSIDLPTQIPLDPSSPPPSNPPPQNQGQLANLSFDSPSEPTGLVYPNSQTTTYTITNSGSGDATSVSFSGLDYPFSIVGGTCGSTLAANSSCTLQVRFDAPGEVLAHDTIVVNFHNGQTNSQITKSITGQASKMTVSVEKVYPFNGNWNDYVINNNGGTNIFNQLDSACTGNEPGGYNSCIHGGDKRKIILTSVTSCNNLSIEDTLDAFNWICDDTGGTATFYSTGLKSNRRLADLITANAWKNNSVKIYNRNYLAAQSTASTWWTNTVTPLPSNPSSTDPVATLASQSTIYTLTSSTTTSGYNINASRIAIVVFPSAVLSYSGNTANNCNSTTGETGAANSICLISAATQKYLWLEGNYSCSASTNANYGINLITNKHSLLRNLAVAGCNSYGVTLDVGSKKNLLAWVKTNNILGVGLYFGGSDDQNTIYNLSTTNNYYGVQVDPSSGANILGGLIVSNNKFNGIYANTDKKTVFHHITATNNSVTDTYAGILLYKGQDRTFSQLALANNYKGLEVQLNSADTFSQMATVNNSYGISFNNSTSGGNKFTNNLLVGSNTTADCKIIAGTMTPGLADTTCANQTPSDATLVTGKNATSSWIAQVNSDYANAYGISGLASSITDFLNFANFFRAWGIEGSVFPNTDQRGQCTGTTTCHVWDWRLKLSDTTLRNRSGDGQNANGAFVAGATCPTAVHGNVALTDKQLPAHTYLVNAMEILEDAIGNDNGLCETNESCIYSPNFGAYQGEGSLVGPCVFDDDNDTALVKNVNMYAWSINGVDSSGALDTTFNTTGTKTFDVLMSGDELVTDMALQSDGKIVVVGILYDGSDTNSFIARLNTDGSLDTSFDTDGLRILNTTANAKDEFRAVKIQKDGKIIVAGSDTETNLDFLVARFNTDGSLDTSFANNGIGVYDFGSGDDFAEALTLQDDGKIVVGGTARISSQDQMGIIRLHPDGSLDTSFDADGKLNLSNDNAITDLIIQPSDSKILVASKNGFIIRLANDGTLDTTFDTDGIQQILPVVNANTTIHSMALQSDGKIVLGGSDHNNVNQSLFLMARLNTDGSLDTSFDTDGKLTTDITGATGETIFNLQILPDGRILAAGYDYLNPANPNEIFLTRYKSTGALDTSFATNGVFRLTPSTNKTILGSAKLQPDGQILLALTQEASSTSAISSLIRIWP